MAGLCRQQGCPVDPNGGGTCRKGSQAPLITESALPLHGKPWRERADDFSCRPAGVKIGICFWAGVPFHYTACLLSYVWEPRRGDWIIGRRFLPLPKKIGISNVLEKLFIFAGDKQEKNATNKFFLRNCHFYEFHRPCSSTFSCLVWRL